MTRGCSLTSVALWEKLVQQAGAQPPVIAEK